MTVSAAEFDAIVNDPRFAPFRGWHGDWDGRPEYLPAVQQDRDEFLALAYAIERNGTHERCLQLGLGHAGGAHSLFARIFREVWTVELYGSLITSYAARFPGVGHLVCGDTRSENTLRVARESAPFDLLFIDAGHLYAEVTADYRDYAPLVRPGGIVAFHDAVQRVPNVEVYRLVDELRASRNISVVGKIGTAWYRT